MSILHHDHIASYCKNLQGYLRHIVESLASEDEALLGLLGGSGDDGIGGGPNMKALYTYESKMAMLTRLAATVAGAELLLESGLMLRYEHK